MLLRMAKQPCALGMPTPRDADDIGASGYGTGRHAQLTAAAKAITVILEQIGPAAALVLLNASIDAVVELWTACGSRPDICDAACGLANLRSAKKQPANIANCRSW